MVGSPTDEFNFNLNVFYASSFNPEDHSSVGAWGQLDHWWAVIRPSDQKWALVNDLSTIVDMRTRALKTRTSAAWNSLDSALAYIKNFIRPAFAVPHLFCFTGVTAYRSLLETAGIPFIGSPSLESTVAADKALTRSLLSAHTLPCPPGRLLTKDTYDPEEAAAGLGLDFPCVVKPTTAENSMGMTLVKTEAQLAPALEKALAISPQVIIDKFIPGRELRCSVVERVDEQSGRRELTPMTPQEYKVRWDDLRTFEDKLAVDSKGMPVGKAPTTVTSFLSRTDEPELFDKIQKLALRVHLCLKFRDFSMIDVRVDEHGEPWLLEVNLFSSFGPKSVLNIHAHSIGWTDQELFSIMAANVMARTTDELRVESSPMVSRLSLPVTPSTYRPPAKNYFAYGHFQLPLM